MSLSNRPPVAVLGGGLAGLTAARHLRQHGVPVRVFEAGPRLAGLARSFHDRDGFSYDFGAHFVTNRLAAAVGILDRCRDVPRYGESVRLQSRFRGYPFGLLRKPRYVASAVSARLALRRKRPESAAEWFTQKYGAALASEVALPLLEAWSGLPADELAPAVGECLPGSIAETLWLTLGRRLTGKTLSIGYSREAPHGFGVWLVYPDGGLGLLCEKLAEGLEHCISLETPVEGIRVEAGRVAAVRAGGKDIAVSAVVSTAPVHILAKLVRGTDALKQLDRFRYRPMVFVNLRLEGRGLLPDVVLWTPEPEYPFFRLTETPLSMPWLAPAGKTLVTVDIGCEVGDAVWTKPDEELGAWCVAHLRGIIPDIEWRYLGCRVLRTPIAYPVYARAYEADRQKFEAGTGVPGLYSVGRNGEFMHIFMEDVYLRTIRHCDRLLEYLTEKSGESAVGAAPRLS
jgi:protoporphyrinogen/coproporphyrinogen III oxidase